MSSKPGATLRRIFLHATALLSLALATGAVHARTIEMKVTGMVCANCVASVKERLSRFADANAGVYVSLEHHTVAMALVDGKDVDDAALERAITEAGFTLDGVSRTDDTLEAIEARHAEGKAEADPEAATK